MTKLASKAACGDISAVQITSNFNIGIRHSLFLTYVIGAFATTGSSIAILTMDFIINLGICFRIAWIKRRKPENTQKIIELLQELAIAEMVEFVVPLVYLICFCIAYFGPNAKLIGNVSNDYWQYVKVKDFGHTITNVCAFFIIDLLSGVSCSIVLFIFCKISLMRVFIALQREFGLIFLVSLVLLLTTVSN